MRVMKFGGLVLTNSAGFAAMTDILKRSLHEPLLLVVSAFATATRDLERSMLLAESGNESGALTALEAVLDQHRSFAHQLLRDASTREALEALINDSERNLKNFLRGVSITQELTTRTLDAALSYGEYCAVHIVRHYLQEQGFTVSFADATSIIVTDAQHLAAKPLYAKTALNVTEKLIPLMQTGKIVLTQGFVGRAENGEITTMGRESSNFTAALLGELVEARDVVIWTDVEGIRTADPKLLKSTRPVPHLSYSQAYIAASNGVKPLDPSMVEPLHRARIALEFRSAFTPDGAFTRISNEEFSKKESSTVPPMLSVQRNVTLLHGQFTTEHAHIDAASVVRDLFSAEQALSATYRNDSFSVIATQAANEERFRQYAPELTLAQHEGYDLISLFNIPTIKLAALTSLSTLFTTYNHHDEGNVFIELGLFQTVSRIAVPHAHSTNVLAVLHNLLVDA